MTSPTAKVLDNQSTSSYSVTTFFDLLATIFPVAMVAVMVFFLEMSVLYAVCATVGVVFLFMIAAIIFAAAAPLLGVLLGAVMLIGCVVFGLASAVIEFFRGFFGAFAAKKPD